MSGMTSLLFQGLGTVLGLLYSHGVMEFLIVPLVLLFGFAGCWGGQAGGWDGQAGGLSPPAA